MKAKKVIDVIQEGVADKAAERMFGIPDETGKSEKQAAISSEDIILVTFLPKSYKHEVRLSL